MVAVVPFERASYTRQADRVNLMLSTIRAMGVASEIVEDGAADTSNAASIATRMAAALVSVLADPQAPLSDFQRQIIWPSKQTVDNIFQASTFATADFALRAMGPPNWANLKGLSPPEQLEAEKRLALLSLDSDLDFPVEAILDLPPQLALLVLTGLVASGPILTKRGEERRERLLALAHRLQPAMPPPTVDHVVLISRAWMNCSYGSHPDKHAIKRVLNQTLVAFNRAIGLHDTSLPPQRALKARPCMVVAAEVMHSNHVQYRYFGQYLRQLRTRFDLVLVTEENQVDDSVRALFDKVLTFERGNRGEHFHQAVQLIRSASPDIVFWPSVGMRHWGPLLANLRLAPLQVTALGHSASTFCPTMDYYLIEEGYVSDPDLFSERLILLPDESLRFERSPHYTPVAPTIRDVAHPVRVAIPSSPLKLNASFFALLQRIRSQAKRPVEFHFFPGVAALECEALRQGLTRVLREAIVYPVLAYKDYVQALSSCDATFSPFPFGGLNTVVDALRQGLPVVAMERPEPHGRTDVMLLRLLAMPAWLVAHTEEDYVTAALKLINNDQVRIDVSRQALALNIDRRLFGDASTPLSQEVIDAVWSVYRHHEAIQTRGCKVWRARDGGDMGLP
jgi:hypothetical protein